MWNNYYVAYPLLALGFNQLIQFPSNWTRSQDNLSSIEFFTVYVNIYARLNNKS